MHAAMDGHSEAPGAGSGGPGAEFATLLVVLVLAGLAGGAALAYSDLLMTAGANGSGGIARFFICH